MGKVLGEIRVPRHAIEDLGAGLYQVSIRAVPAKELFFGEVGRITPGESQFVLTTDNGDSHWINITNVMHYAITADAMVDLTIQFHYATTGNPTNIAQIAPQVTEILAHNTALAMHFAMSFPHMDLQSMNAALDTIEGMYSTIEHLGTVYYLQSVRQKETRIEYRTAETGLTRVKLVISGYWGIYSSKKPAVYADMEEMVSIINNKEGCVST